MGAGAAAAGLMAGGGILGAYGSIQSGRAQSAYYGYLAGQSKIESGLVKAQGERAASDTETAAAFEQRIMARNQAKTMGAQRAAFAANGIAGSVTAQDITKDTIDKADLDMEAVRFNADTRASAERAGANFQSMDLMGRAGGDEFAGRSAASAGRIGAYSSVLGAGGSLASMWYRSNN
jgi:hypothetical protein